MISPLLAAALLLGSSETTGTRSQATAIQTQAEPQVQVETRAQAAPSTDAVDLGEVMVEGRRLEDMTRDFVRQVGAPSRNRGLARWRDGVCVGVANLQSDVAQFIVDRVSTVAEDVGLRAGHPGCTPSVLVVAVSDANSFTSDFISSRPRLFRVGGVGMDRGGAALEKFKENGQPVRWWIVTAPVDSDTGQIATRIPGFIAGETDNGAQNNAVLYGPNINTRQASRFSTQIVDDAKRAFIIVDVNKIGDISAVQLAEYIAFVALAQVDPEADATGYASILNVFSDPQQTEGLTQWDRAYLRGLYDAVRTRQNLGANATEIVSSIVKARRDMARSENPID